MPVRRFGANALSGIFTEPESDFPTAAVNTPELSAESRAILKNDR